MNAQENVITAHDFFHGMKAAHLGVVAGAGQHAEFHAGDILFRQREPAGTLYFVESGFVAIEFCKPNGHTLIIDNVGPGDALGWSWLFPPFSWHYQARAVTDVKCIAINGAHLLVAAEEDHDFGYELMKRVVRLLMRRQESACKRLQNSQEVYLSS